MKSSAEYRDKGGLLYDHVLLDLSGIVLLKFVATLFYLSW